MKTTILLSAIFCFVAQITFSQAGQRDSSFGRYGVVVTDMGKNRDNISLGRKVLLQPDGSTYIIYITTLSYQFPETYNLGVTFITKKHADGTTDSSYANNGTTSAINISATDAALQADGKIIIMGNPYYHDFNVARYNTKGGLDTTFSNDGKLTVPSATSVALQRDGKIVFGGGNNISRYNIDGSADGTFDGDGVQTFDFTTSDVAVQKDGKIVAAGYSYWYQPRFIVARITSFGKLDKSFSDNGIYKATDSTTDSKATSVAIQSDGKIVIATGSPDVFNSYLLDISVWRFTAGGVPDKSFSGDGKQTTEFGTYRVSFNNLVTIQNDGKIVAAGYSLILRYNTDGSPDKSFSNDGKLTVNFKNDRDRVSSLAEEANGKIIVVGSSYIADEFGDVNNTYYAAARFSTNGTVDNTFAANGILQEQLRLGDTEFKSVAVQKDGKIVAVGITFNGHDEDFAVVRYNTNGTLDTTFSGDGKQTTDFDGLSNSATAVAIQSDGKIVVAGYSGYYVNYGNDFVIARYNVDGSLDKTFSGDGKQITDFGSYDEAASSIALQKDGKIVVAGYTSKEDSSKENFAVARYNTDGSLDKTFSGDGKQITDNGLRHDRANAIGIQNDGKIVIGGSTGYGRTNFAVVRYNSDGHLDKTFGKNGIRTISFNVGGNLISSIAIQSDGKIVAAGKLGDYANSVIGVARLNTNGSLDSSFSDDGLQSTTVGTSGGYYPFFAAPVAIQNDGKIIAAANYQYNSGLDEGFALVRYNANGNLDSTFSEDGIQTNNGYITYGIAVLNNKLYTVGHRGFGLYNAHFGFVGRFNLLNKNKNSAPVVSITAPSDNQIIPGFAASITLKAAASDPDGTVSKIEFYNGSVLLHTETRAPYTFTLKNLSAGTYTITAKATDNLSLSTVSAPVNITVTNNTVTSNKPYSENEKTALNDALGLRLSPNPASNIVNVYTSGLQQNKPATLSIISVSGIVLKTMQMSNSSTQLNVSSLASGVYTLKIVSGDKFLYKQFVKL